MNAPNYLRNQSCNYRKEEYALLNCWPITLYLTDMHLMKHVLSTEANKLFYKYKKRGTYNCINCG